MNDDLLAAMMGNYDANWPYPADGFTKKSGMGIAADESSALTADMVRQLQNRLRNNTPSVDWRSRREHVDKFKETYVKLRSENIALSHHAAIELAKLIYKESETITWEDTQ